MIKIAICDDDKKACDSLNSLIIKANKELSVKSTIDIFYSTSDLKKSLEKKNSYDLIFLDIEFDDINGIQLGTYIRKTLNDHHQQIVYISGFNSYDRQLFDNQPFNFIPKPFDYKKVKSVLNDYIDIYKHKEELFHFKQKRKQISIPISKIVYFKSYGRKVTVLCIDGHKYKSYDFYDKISNINDQLNEYRFLLIHKSFLVQYRYITEFGYKAIKMINDEIFSISQSNRKKIRELRLKWESEEC